MNFAATLTSRLASRSFSSRMSERKAESASIASSQGVWRRIRLCDCG